MIPFIDISGIGQGKYSLLNYKNKMLMMKSSGGDAGYYLDSQLVNNYAGAKKLGIIPFMYHVAGNNNPVDEAKYYLEAVSPLSKGDGYALDIEPTCYWTPAEVLQFVKTVYNKTKCYPWVYMDISRYNSADWSAVYALCGKWLAAPSYSFSATIPNVGIYIAQQGSVVNGVDTDMFFGTLEELLAYTFQYTPVKTTSNQPISEPSTTKTVTTVTSTTTAQITPSTSPSAMVNKTNTNMPSVQDKASSLNTKLTLPTEQISINKSQLPVNAPTATTGTQHSWWSKILVAVWNFIKNI